MAGPNQDFWQERFVEGKTPWDRQHINPQLFDWLASGVINKTDTVVVPGCGHGREVLGLVQHGVTVIGLDYAPAAVEQCQHLLLEQGVTAQIEQADVTTWLPSDLVDVVYDQACFCALHPDLWLAYAQQLYAWLKPGGRLAFLVVQALRDSAQQGYIEGPPYHCDINAIRALFPSDKWIWPKPPYTAHQGKDANIPFKAELVLVLTKR